MIFIMHNKQLILIFLTALSIWACNVERESHGTLYLSNISQNYFDSATFNIFIDDKLVTSDTIKNKYISSYWEEKQIPIPNRNFNFKVSVTGKGFTVKKDTTVRGRDSLSLFVRFNFYPYYKRYHNPEIFKHLTGETTRLKAIADSLYENNLLSNAAEYLNDTIPSTKNIEIVVK
jgi:hypothetical protein